MRQLPFDNLLVKLQGFNLENPNRCFLSIDSILSRINTGQDNRELIPEFFSKIDFLLNLNCSSYGEKDSKILVDDCEMQNIITKKKKTYLSIYVDFLLEHKKIMNSKLIGIYLKEWIDNIFGCNQLPPKNKRKESYNIFVKYSYEQIINLEKKLDKKLKKGNKTEKKIKTSLKTNIDYIINFGVCPSVIFKEPHPKLNLGINNNININRDNNKYKEDINDDEDNNDIEAFIQDSIASQKLYYSICGELLFFKINPTINKIFVYIKEGDLIILSSKLFNEIYYNYSYILKHSKIEKLNLLYTPENQEYQIKYAFSSFDKDINYFNNNNDNNNYHTYYYNKINYLVNKNKIINEYKDLYFNEIQIITCRHIDFSFKIHYIYRPKIDKKKNNIRYKTYSFICEDFVTCCACISGNSFIIGLNNGKLIYYIIKENPIFFTNNNKIEPKNNIKLEKKIYIKGHNGIINAIEIDRRLGIVITSGDDNYIFIRKLFDFELLLSIIIKNKYEILMPKISSYNFLYVLCLNKINNKKIIFGYTLSGMIFAKSEYGLYDNINFTQDGNIITFNNKKKLTILSGSDLTELSINNNEETKNIIKQIQNSNWLQYDFLLREGEEEFIEMITFLEKNEKSNSIRTLNVENLLNIKGY